MDTHLAPEAVAIARLIRAQMAIRGISQTRLAAELGISQSHLSRKLNGRLAFDLDEIITACQILGIDPQETLVRGIRMARGADPDNFSIIDAVTE